MAEAFSPEQEAAISRIVAATLAEYDKAAQERREKHDNDMKAAIGQAIQEALDAAMEEADEGESQDSNSESLNSGPSKEERWELAQQVVGGFRDLINALKGQPQNSTAWLEQFRAQWEAMGPILEARRMGAEDTARAFGFMARAHGAVPDPEGFIDYMYPRRPAASQPSSNGGGGSSLQADIDRMAENL